MSRLSDAYQIERLALNLGENYRGALAALNAHDDHEAAKAFKLIERDAEEISLCALSVADGAAIAIAGAEEGLAPPPEPAPQGRDRWELHAHPSYSEPPELEPLCAHPTCTDPALPADTLCEFHAEKAARPR